MGVAGVAGELAPPAGGDAADADPQAFEVPKASPATTQGVVSEVIVMLLPGGCVTAMVALPEPAAVVLGTVGGVTGMGVVGTGDVVGAGGVDAGGDVGAGEVGGVVADGVGAGGVVGAGVDGAAPPRLVKAAATSEEDR